MKKFNAEEALNGAPVKLRNGQKAYTEKYNEGAVFVYSGYVDDENETITSWTKEGTEYCFVESQRDIVSMWQEEDEDSATEDNAQASPEAEESIFDKALKEKLPLRYTILADNISDFYCIAKTSYGDYIVEREDNGATYISKLSDFENDLNWYIAEPKLPKAFIPEENEEFWFIHTMKNKTVAYASYCDNDVYYNGLVSAGLAFRTKEEATQALRFLRNNIEVNNGKEQK